MNTPAIADGDLAAIEQAIALQRLHREMRVPLNTVLGHLQLLQSELGPSDGVGARLRTIETAALRLLDLLDGLLALGSEPAGENGPQLRPVPLHDLVQRHAPMELSLLGDADRELSVWADPAVLIRMIGVMGGLISAGGLPWGASRLSWRADGDVVVLEFDAHWPEPPVALDPPGVRLALLARLAEAQQVPLEGPHRQADRLRLAMRLRRVVTDPGTHDPVAQPQPGGILLVEDDPANADVIIGYLGGRLGLQVIHAVDVRGAIQLLERHAPRLVLLDMYLPGESGTAFLRHLRAVDPLHRVGCIVLTSAAGSGVERTVRELGADDYLDKPVRLDVLRRRVQRLLGLDGV